MANGGDGGNRISSPEWGPRPKWNAHPCWVRVRQSGDAGNRISSPEWRRRPKRNAHPCWVRVRQSGDAGNRISSPEWGPRPKWNAHPCWVRVRQSGDAGNRTRVRKNRPSEIYERSRSKVVTTGISSGTNRLQPAALSFARVAASGAALRVCLARAGPWRRSGPVDGSHE